MNWHHKGSRLHNNGARLVSRNASRIMLAVRIGTQQKIARAGMAGQIGGVPVHVYATLAPC